MFSNIHSSISSYNQLVFSSDYYPFGMLMDNRHGSENEGYRYGFQGQEKDDEVAGEGNSYTAEFWQYDSRLGRRWNLDPVVKNHESPYATFANNPVLYVDPNGADTSVVDSEGKLIEKRSGGDDVLQMKLISEDGSTIYYDLWSNDYNDRRDPENDDKWINDFSRLNNANIGDQVLFFFSDANINHIMNGSYISVQDYPFGYAWDNSNLTMDFSSILVNNFFSGEVPLNLSDAQMDNLPVFIFFGTNEEFVLDVRGEIGDAGPDSEKLYNLMDAGNYLWGQAMYRIGNSYSITRMGSNGNELFSGRLSDSDADQRAIKNGYYKKMSTVNYSIHVRFKGLQLHMYMDYEDLIESIYYPLHPWPGKNISNSGWQEYKNHNKKN